MVEIDKPSDYFHVDAEGNFTRPKSARRIAHISCSRPGCPNHDDPKSPKFKRCAKCRTLYCSRECQKSHWRSHKIICTAIGPESSKILLDISTTPLLRLYFAVLVILKFGLHLLDSKSLEEISSKPLGIDVYLQHEPASIKDFLQLFNLSSWQDTPPMMSIPQIVDVQFEKQDVLSSKEAMENWTACREDELAKRPGGLTIVVDVCYQQSMGGRSGRTANFDYLSAASQGIHAYFKLSSLAFTLARQGIFPPIPISFEDFKYEWQPTPMNVENHIAYINANIRWDSIQNGNQLRLGTKLPEFEKHMISLASASNTLIRHPESAEFVNFIRKKVRSENIYRMAAAYYEHESEVIPKVSMQDLEGIRVL